MRTIQKIWRRQQGYGPLYFDLDHANFDIAYADCIKVYEHLRSYVPAHAILIYFTGKKGFHIECEPVTIGINPGNNLPKIFRHIATSLKFLLSLSSLDFSVYDARRMWRVPGTMHQDTNLYKTLLNAEGEENYIYKNESEIKKFSSIQRLNLVAPQAFDYKANEWYRAQVYSLEQERNQKDNPIEYFNKYGSKVFKELKESEKIFDRDNLLSKCTAIGRLKEQAETKHFLEHEARLFLCSILSYSEDAVRFLHEILSHCSDYNFDKSSAHINDWIKRRHLQIGGRPYTCDRANAVGVGCGDCNLEKRNKWEKIGDRFVETNVKSAPSPVRHAYKTKKIEEEKHG